MSPGLSATREFQHSDVSLDTEAMTALATDSGRKTPARLAGSAILALQSDERLVKLARSGHERAFDTIVERYRKPLVRYCRRILPESRCEDAVQQALLNAHAALTTSEDPLQLKPWLFAITRNAALNMLRQNGWNYDEIPLDFDGVRRPDQVFEERSQLQQTVTAVKDLPDRQRDALVMREFEGRSYDEIALALGANDGAVRQLLNRARVTLRSAASAFVPPPLVVRAATSMPPSDGRRLTEIIGGLGAAGIAKAGATAVVAGTLVVGAVEAPLPVGESHKTTREKATLAADDPTRSTMADQPVANHLKAAALTAPVRTETPASNTHGSGHSGHGRSGTSELREVEHHGRTEERHRSGSDDGTRSGDDQTRSGSGDGTRETTQTDDHSGPGGGGSDDEVTATLIPSDDATGTSGISGTSGSGSGESSSGSSGSDDSLNSGSGSSGSDDSTSSGTSGSSGETTPTTD
jgi:RNA polymerase sigma factor (sigma-70 family)